MIIVPGGSAGDIEGVTAGDGLSGGGNSGSVTVTLDLNELTAAAVADGDSIPIIDANDSNASRKESVADLATLFAGDGLAASSSVIGVDLGTNPGLEIDSNKLQIAKGISQHDVAQFTSGVVDDDFLRVDGTVIEGRSASEVLSDIGGQASLTFGISNTNAVKVDSASVADDEYARFTANGLESRSTSEVLSDIGATGVGTQDMWIPASAMRPASSNGCAKITDVESTSGRPDMQVLDFDKDSDEFAQFSVAFPQSYNAGTVTFQAYWTSAGTNTGTVAWGMAGVSCGDNDTIDVAYGTAVVATAKAHSGTAEDLNVSAESGAITIANAAKGELVFFAIHRDVSADDNTGDARLIGVKLSYTTDAATD